MDLFTQQRTKWGGLIKTFTPSPSLAYNIENTHRKYFWIYLICEWWDIWRNRIFLRRQAFFPAVNTMFAKWKRAISELLQVYWIIELLLIGDQWNLLPAWFQAWIKVITLTVSARWNNSIRLFGMHRQFWTEGLGGKGGAVIAPVESPSCFLPGSHD